ncbi:NYN domain-containing protein [Cellulosimicrobium sp. E-16]|uniref:NYN domain-containing protein n=1 Tax=Cellulosimicrobium sp. E-16 TaxID=3404049 RepID=UPI003CF9F42A
MKPQVAVLIDYQNAHASGHERYCDAFSPLHECLLDPSMLAQKVVEKRAPGGEVAHVRVYRGRPDARKQPTLASVNDQQFSAWISDPKVDVIRRPLWYPRDYGEATCAESPREKGIDVKLAIDLIRLAYESSYDVFIVFSRDTDLLPPIEMVREYKMGHVEVAGWDGSSRLRLPKLWHHELDAADFEAVRDTREYRT